MTVWVAVDIGCIECGEASDVIGVFTDADRASAACDIARARHLADWHGQHSFEVFETTVDAFAEHDGIAE